MEIVGVTHIFSDFPKRLLLASHNFLNNTYHIALTDVLPDLEQIQFSDSINIPPVNIFGYPLNGYPISMNVFKSNGMGFVSANPVIFTASGGKIGPFRYAILYNHNNWYLVSVTDYKNSITLEPTDTFTVQFEDGILFRNEVTV